MSAIRMAGEDDIRAIEPLMAAFNRAEGIAWHPPTMVPALRRLLREPRLGLVLLTHDAHAGAAIGYALATFGFDLEFAGVDAFLTELYVTPDQRGHGVGSRLLLAMLDVLRARGAGAVHLMVRPENETARALYERAGFETVPRIMMTHLLT